MRREWPNGLKVKYNCLLHLEYNIDKQLFQFGLFSAVYFATDPKAKITKQNVSKNKNRILIPWINSELLITCDHLYCYFKNSHFRCPSDALFLTS